MNSAGDLDSYYFAGDAGWTGKYAITASALSGSVDPVVAVYDAATGIQLGFNDDSGGEPTARLSLVLDGLTRYIVAVADATGSGTGSVEISIRIADSSPYTTIDLDPAGHGSSTGRRLNSVTDTHFFRLTAPTDARGDLTVRVAPTTGALDTAVAVFDESGSMLGRAFSAGAGSEDVLSLTGLSAAAVYYLSVLSRNYATSGDFDVHVEFGLIPPATIDVAVDPDFAWGRVNQLGEQTGLHSFGVGDPSIMEIRPEGSGPISLTLSSAAVDDVVLGLYDAAGNRVASGVGLDGAAATINYPGSGAMVYYVYSSSYDGSQSGNYSLTIDVPSFPLTADVVVNPTTGSGSYAAGQISPRSDQDFFRIVAPVNAAGLTVTMTPDTGSSLKPYVRLYDANGARLAADDAASGAAQFTYASVTPGATYIIGAGGNWYTSGAFDLDVEFELYDVPLTAPALEYYGPVSLQGDRDITEVHINFTSDRDAWRFATRAVGSTTFTATAAAGINPLLALYDGTGRLVAVGESSSGTTETMSYSLTPQEIYTILVQDAERDGIGNVDLRIDSPAASAAAVALDEAGRGSSQGLLAYGADPARAEPDYYEFTAPANALGRMSLTVEPLTAFRLEMQLFDSAGSPVGVRYASPSGGAPATHVYNALNPGEAYHVCVFAYQFADHVSPAEYTVDVDFDLALQVVSTSVENGRFIPPGGVTFAVRFNETARVDDGDFELSGAAFGGWLPGSWHYDPAGSELIIAYAALPADTYTFTLRDSVTDTIGNRLDGNADGMPGGDYAVNFAVAIAGDANFDGAVDYVDYVTIKRNFGLSSGADWAKADFDADGDVDYDDYVVMRDNFGQAMASPVHAPATGEAIAAAEEDAMMTMAAPEADPAGAIAGSLPRHGDVDLSASDGSPVAARQPTSPSLALATDVLAARRLLSSLISLHLREDGGGMEILSSSEITGLPPLHIGHGRAGGSTLAVARRRPGPVRFPQIRDTGLSEQESDGPRSALGLRQPDVLAVPKLAFDYLHPLRPRAS
jgi:hypothetical protein